MKPARVGIQYVVKSKGFTLVISPQMMEIFIGQRHQPPNRKRYSRKWAWICLLKFWESSQKASNTISMPFLSRKPLSYKDFRDICLPSNCRRQDLIYII